MILNTASIETIVAELSKKLEIEKNKFSTEVHPVM